MARTNYRTVHQESVIDRKNNIIYTTDSALREGLAEYSKLDIKNIKLAHRIKLETSTRVSVKCRSQKKFMLDLSDDVEYIVGTPIRRPEYRAR